jgi:hypothetical protein
MWQSGRLRNSSFSAAVVRHLMCDDAAHDNQSGIPYKSLQPIEKNRQLKA